LIEWKEILEEASRRVERASVQLSGGEDRGRVVGVGASGDRTLVVDRVAESAAIDVIRRVSDVRILSEERGEIGRRESKWTVLLDPIDGSANFERGIPFYCTSLAVARGNSLDDTEYALVRNLANGDVYYAERGAGARKNGRSIQTSSTNELRDSVAAIDVSRGTSGLLERLAPLVSTVKRQVHFGANALELCMLGEGRIDIFVDLRGRMRVTDLAGGVLIVREAGGIVSGESGRDFEAKADLQGRYGLIASGNRKLHSGLLRVLD